MYKEAHRKTLSTFGSGNAFIAADQGEKGTR
jgi:hypothetical protein